MQVTSCKEVQARLAGDKLRWTGGVKIGLAAAFLRCLEQLHTKLRAVRLPLLVPSSPLLCLTLLLQVLHGDNDSLCQPAGSALLVREARWARILLCKYQTMIQVCGQAAEALPRGRPPPHTGDQGAAD